MVGTRRPLILLLSLAVLGACRHQPPASGAEASAVAPQSEPEEAAADPEQGKAFHDYAPKDCPPGTVAAYALAAQAWHCMELAAPQPAPVVSLPSPSIPTVSLPAQASSATSPPSCTRDPAREAPVVRGALGHGSRTVELLNTTEVEVQVRLLDEADQVAVDGTLLIAAGGRGVFHVEPGSFHVRLRENATCQVFDGTPFTISPDHAGVTIALSAIFHFGSHHDLEDVDKEL